MKRLFAGAASATLILCISCGNPNTPSSMNAAPDSSAMATTAKEPTQAEKNRDNMKTVYKGIETGDLSAMDGFCNKDFVDHNSPKGDINGLDSLKKVLSDVHNHFSDLKMDMLSCATDGDYVMTLVAFSGKTKDATMHAPVNTVIHDTSMDVVKVVNGMATEHWSYERPKMPMNENKKK